MWSARSTVDRYCLPGVALLALVHMFASRVHDCCVERDHFPGGIPFLLPGIGLEVHLLRL